MNNYDFLSFLMDNGIAFHCHFILQFCKMLTKNKYVFLVTLNMNLDIIKVNERRLWVHKISFLKNLLSYTQEKRWQERGEILGQIQLEAEIKRNIWLRKNEMQRFCWYFDVGKSRNWSAMNCLVSSECIFSYLNLTRAI